MTIVHGEVCDAAVETGGQGDDHPPSLPDFGTSVNPISIRGADYARKIIFRSSYGPVTEAGFSSESFLHGR